MSLKTLELNAEIGEGYVSEPLQKDGGHSVFVATFGDVAGGEEVKLEQSVDGSVWSDIPNSEVNLEAGQTEQMWNDAVTPRGTLIRINVSSSTGTLVAIKLLSNE